MDSITRLPTHLAVMAASAILAGSANAATLVGGGAAPFNVLNQTCNRFLHQAVIKNGSIYQDGGLNVFTNYTSYTPIPSGPINGTEIIGQNLFLIQTDISTSWNATTNISMNGIQKSPNGYPQSGSTYNKPPIVSNAALYGGLAKDPRIWLFGGTTSWWNVSWVNFTQPTDNTYTLWSVDTETEAWTSHDVTHAVPERPNNGFSAEDPATGRAWWINGFLESGSDTNTQVFGDNVKAFQNGMLAFNFSGSLPTVKNVSSTSNPWGPPRVGGLAEYVPLYGKDGVLVMFGGGFKSAAALTSDDHGSYVDMSDIWVWDLNRWDSNNVNGSWYKQRATGDIPAARGDSCSVSWAAPDNSSYQIYVHAGRTGNAFYDDLYVLSLPQFRWTRIYDTDAIYKFGHTCHRGANNQIIRTGGVNTWSLAKGGDCDNSTRQISVFDLQNPNAGWTSAFTQNDAPYQVPSQVYAAIGGNSTGGSVSQTPSAGWASDELRRVFNREVISDSSNRLSGGAVAGIVIGVVIVVAILAGIVVYFLILRPRRQRHEELRTPHGELDGNEAGRSAPVVKTYAEKDGESIVRYEKDGAVYEKRTSMSDAQRTPTEMPGDAIVFEMDGRGVGEPKKELS